MLKKIIKFGASWCAPCKALAPIIEEISQDERFNEIEFSEIDIDNDEDLLTEKYGIRNIPTLIMLNEEGEAMKRLVGMLPKEKIEQEILELMTVKTEEEKGC